MVERLFKKGLVVGIIVLFIGVGVQPALAVDTKQSIDDNKDEECRECNEVCDADLIKLKSLLNRIEQRTKLLLVLSKNNPEIKNNYDKLDDMISKLNTLGLREICIWLFNIFYDIYIFTIPYYEELAWDYYSQYRLILAFISFSIGMMYLGLIVIGSSIFYSLNCDDILNTHFITKEHGNFTPFLEVEYEKAKNFDIQNQFFSPIQERFPSLQRQIDSGWWNVV
jgi:hypothetical protein